MEEISTDVRFVIRLIYFDVKDDFKPRIITKDETTFDLLQEKPSEAITKLNLDFSEIDEIRKHDMMPVIMIYVCSHSLVLPEDMGAVLQDIIVAQSQNHVAKVSALLCSQFLKFKNETAEYNKEAMGLNQDP